MDNYALRTRTKPEMTVIFADVAQWLETRPFAVGVVGGILFCYTSAVMHALI